MWNENYKKRYARHLTMPSWNEDAQKKISRAKVLIVGAGGLGSAASLFVAAAGVGTIVIVDSDTVEPSNLNRQVLFTPSDIGASKAEKAGDRLKALNPDCEVLAHDIKVDSENAGDFFKDADVALDCTDGFPNKYLLNDTAVATGTPLAHAGVLAWSGQMFFIEPGKGPCLRCVFPNPPPEGKYPTSETVGILGAVAGMFGSLQAAEAIKFIAGAGERLVGRMLTFDALYMQWQTVKISRDEKCPACGGIKP